MRRLLGCALLLSGALPTTAQAEPPPVIAVFPIEDSSGNLSPKALNQLGDYLSVKLTETGRFQVVPRKDLEAQLGDKKKDSYKACYDQACQIEIGKEVAAQKILHTQIVEIGGQCAVTATLYDLRIAATEKAASQKGACTEAAIVTSLEAVVTSLAHGMSASAPPPPSVPPPSAPPPPAVESGFTLRVEAEPSDAEILVDGQLKGRGSAAVPVPKGSSHQISIEREGFVSESHQLRFDRDEHLNVALAMTPERRAARSEWVGGAVTAGTTLGISPLFGMAARGPTLRLGPIAWSLAELDLAFGAGARTTVNTVEGCENPRSSSGPALCDEDPLLAALFSAMTRPAVHLALDEVNSLEIGLGLGAHVLVAIDGQHINDRYVGPALQPSLRYWHRGDGPFAWGAGLKASLPLLVSCTSNALESFVSCRSGSPILIQAEVPFGYVD